MNSPIINRRQLVEHLIEELDIPISYYQRACDRASSLEAWLLRDNSTVKDLSPEVYPQGSFRYGTVIRPIHRDGYYDLDLVVTFQLSKSQVTQEQVKKLLGNEIKAYAEAKQFNEKPSEKPRCWRLNYADDVSFHMDILPGLPAGEGIILERVQMSVDIDLAQHEISITDKRHPHYRVVSDSWFSSNPRGFAKWFERIARSYAGPQITRLMESRAYASVDEIPPYELKTTLQRVIQLLKRHRDVHFIEDAAFAPISMIITTLATQAYQGHESLPDALVAVVSRMPSFVESTYPRIPNPVNRKEDFADKWRTDSRYELNFQLWHQQLLRDVQSMVETETGRSLQESIEKAFDVEVPDEICGISHRPSTAPRVITSPAPIIIPSGPKPWGA